jgi:hypothetical protein
MKLAILTDNAPSFHKPLAEGLERMVRRAGASARVFHEGLDLLQSFSARPGDGRPRSRLSALFANDTDVRWENFCDELDEVDVIVVVNNIPGGFLRDRYAGIEALREQYPTKPIVLYANYYLGSHPWWVRWLRDGNPEKGVRYANNFGVDRYDWYLASSIMSVEPLDHALSHPLSVIGVDLADPSLFPAPGKAENPIALLDFERSGHEGEREIQIAALEETNTPYEVLNGEYSHSEIRSIYRRAGFYFVASNEGFGLPIIETQLCGALVFTPYRRWVSAHWLGVDSWETLLSPNFVVYHNDREKLKSSLRCWRNFYDPLSIVRNLSTYQPQFLHGDGNALTMFLDRCSRREIHGGLHKRHASLNESIVGALS